MPEAPTTRDDPTCEQVERARMLALTLEKVASEYPEHFAMAAWLSAAEGYSYESIDRVGHVQGRHPVDCGTAGCALGWAPYATGVPGPNKGFNDSWLSYAADALGITGWWFSYIFLTDLADEGEAGATAAAARLWEWIDAHQDTCRE